MISLLEIWKYNFFYFSRLESLKEDNREAILHLYILYGDSHLLRFTRCAWKNYLLRGTLLFDPVINEKYNERLTRKHRYNVLL